MDSECLNLLQELQGSAPGGKCLSFDLPMGGDDDDIVAPVLVGSELVLVNDATRLCMGKISETKVCLCLLQDCNVRRAISGTKCRMTPYPEPIVCSWEAVLKGTKVSCLQHWMLPTSPKL